MEITGPMLDRFDEILTPEALDFVAALQREFGARRLELLDARQAKQAELSAGGTLDFLPETKAVREGEWRVAPPAPGLEDRRVEITGPVDRKMTINALNSGAKVWLADFEDANSPLWDNMRQRPAQPARRARPDDRLRDRRQDATRSSPTSELATIVVRPRGWHLDEKHVLVDGRPVSASLFDFGLYFFHCAQRQLDKGKGPYFYLPKMESHLEARLWNDVFVRAQDAAGDPAAARSGRPC